MRAISLLLFAIILGAALALTGCQQSARPVEFGPQLDADGHRRSLALDTPILSYMRSTQPPESQPPWYASRNDFTPAATAGYALPTIQSSVTITRDRQYNSNGNVRDNFSSTTYRREYRQTVR